MAKWKCEICGSEFENYQAQGFNHKIYCPLCYFKELYKREKQENQQLKKQKDDVVECCNKSIKSINEKLENNKEPFEVVDGKIIYLNDYQVVRLKVIRMKCKEILRMLGEIDEQSL